MAIEIKTDRITNHKDFAPPTFGAIDFGIPADGSYSMGYKMIGFEPGTILQAQELNEIQFRMNVHQTLTMKMMQNWLNKIVTDGTSSTSGPGWEGATPISPDIWSYSAGTNSLLIKNNSWHLCKANSSGLFFWLYLSNAVSTQQYLSYPMQNVQIGKIIGFKLSTTANQEFTGEIATCNTSGPLGLHPLKVSNSSACASSRYYLKIESIDESDTAITNSFVGAVRKTSNTVYNYLNNFKIG